MNIEYSRIIWKRSTIPGTVPTIPTGSTIDNSWLSTDLLVGEAFLNTADDRFFFRTQNGIVEIPLSGVSSGGTYTVDAYLNGNEIVFDRNDILSAYTVDLTPLVSGVTADNYVTGGTYNSITEELEFVGTNPATTFNVDVSALLDDTNTYTTGATLNGNAISFDRNDILSAYTVDLTPIIPEIPSNLTFFSTTAASDIGGYGKLVISLDDPDYDTVAVDVSTGAITTTSQLIASLVADAGIFAGNPGIINISTIGEIRRTGGSGVAEFYYEVYQRDSGGTETLIATSNKTSPVSTSVYQQFQASALFNNGTWLETDRVVIKYYGDRITGGSDPTYDFSFGGTNPVRTLFPISAQLLLNVPITIGVTGVVGGVNGNLLSVDSNGKLAQLNPNVFTDYYTTGATLNNTIISFDRNDLLDAYSVDIKPALNNYLPLNITGDTSVSIDDAITLTISGSDNSKIYNYIQYGDANDEYNGLFLDKSNAVIFNQDTTSTALFAVSASGSGGARLSFGDSGGTITSMYINKSSAKVESNISGFNGLQYGADYSTNYTNRSLVDKGYIDGLISSAFTGYTYVTEDTINEIFDTEIVSSGNIKSKFILDPNGNDIGTGMYVEDLTNGFVSQVYLDSTAYQQTLSDSGLAIYQSNIESRYTSIFGSENITITLQTANLQSTSNSQIRLNTDLIADTSEIGISSDDIILTGDILLDGTVTLTTVGTDTPVNNLAVDSNGDIVEGTDTYVTGGTFSSGTLTLTRNDAADITITGITGGGSSTVPYDTTLVISDETTNIVVGTDKITFYAPRAFTITNVYASLSTAGSTNSVFDINVNGSSILSTKITVEASEEHSKDATTQPVISSTSIAQFDKITVDIDTAGTGARGAKIYINGTYTI